MLLQAGGVDLSRVVAIDAATGCAGIFVDQQGRDVIGVGSGANLGAVAEVGGSALLGPATTLLLQMEVPAAGAAALIRRARARHARMVLNLAPAALLDHDALRALDVLVL